MITSALKTNHQSQGLTIDWLEVDLANGNFADGQAYVALSRSVGFDSLGIKNMPPIQYLRTSKMVGRFYSDISCSARLPTWDQQPPPDMLCGCGIPAALKTSRTQTNPGRRFYACHKGPRQKGGCGHFVWYDMIPR